MTIARASIDKDLLSLVGSPVESHHMIPQKGIASTLLGAMNANEVPGITKNNNIHSNNNRIDLPSQAAAADGLGWSAHRGNHHQSYTKPSPIIYKICR
jgi:hypothetical protein